MNYKLFISNVTTITTVYFYTYKLAKFKTDTDRDWETNGFVYRQEDGNNFNGDDIFSLYQTPYVYMEDPEVRKTIHSVNTYLRAEGVLTVVMALEYDYGDTDVTNPTDFSFTTVGAAAYYDKALYDAAEIYDGNPSPIRSTNVSQSRS